MPEVTRDAGVLAAMATAVRCWHHWARILLEVSWSHVRLLILLRFLAPRKGSFGFQEGLNVQS